MVGLSQELRFIFPALPLFNLVAGVGMSRAVRGISLSAVSGKDDADDAATTLKMTQRFVYRITIMNDYILTFSIISKSVT